MGYVLRGYQSTCVDAAARELLARHRALVVMATGGGKTIVFAALSERWRPIGRTLVLAHREELLDQAAEKIHAATLLRAEIEQADRRVSRAQLPDVVVASVPTLAQPQRRETFARNAFRLVVVDEAHHGVADSYRAVLSYFSPAAAILGVTATPDRADGAPLSTVFGNTVFRYGIRRAVRDGYLVDIRRALELVPGLDLSRVRVRAGDWDAADLEAELTKAPAVAAVANALLRRAGSRPTVAFCAGVLHSKAIAAALNALRPGCAAYASGDERDGVRALTEGRVQFLCNTDLTTEGFDYPPLACVALVRPTKSTGRATQQVGRGTRLAPGKDDLLVVEFVGGKAGGQVSTVDVVGSDLTANVRAAAEQILDRSPALSVLDALERAAANLGTSAIGRGERKARAVLDPMALVLRLDGMIMRPPIPGAPPATAEQVRLLEAEGLRAAGLDRPQASMLLNGIRWRRGVGRCSPMQAIAIHAFGGNVEASAMEASRFLVQLRGVAA